MFEFEDLSDVVVVFHSYSGVLAGPVAQRCSARIRCIVYLGAFLAQPGESLLDVEPAEVGDHYRSLAAESATGDVIPASTAFLDQWGVRDPAQRDWVAPRLTSFPFRCVTDRVEFDAAALDLLRQVYVRHTNPPLASLDLSFGRARDRGWETHDLDTGHDCMIEAPTITAALLGRISAGDA